ncbi:MAG: hypothetical protein ACLTRS_13810 [Lachnospiraceae bacterium]
MGAAAEQRGSTFCGTDSRTCKTYGWQSVFPVGLMMVILLGARAVYW